jgi:hypothetical protein
VAKPGRFGIDRPSTHRSDFRSRSSRIAFRTRRTKELEKEVDVDISKFTHEVRDYALANYDSDGWDFVVEAYTDEELSEEIDNAQTLRSAIDNVRRICKVRDEQREGMRSWTREYLYSNGKESG